MNSLSTLESGQSSDVSKTTLKRWSSISYFVALLAITTVVIAVVVLAQDHTDDSPSSPAPEKRFKNIKGLSLSSNLQVLNGVWDRHTNKVNATVGIACMECEIEISAFLFNVTGTYDGTLFNAQGPQMGEYMLPLNESSQGHITYTNGSVDFVSISNETTASLQRLNVRGFLKGRTSRGGVLALSMFKGDYDKPTNRVLLKGPELSKESESFQSYGFNAPSKINGKYMQLLIQFGSKFSYDLTAAGPVQLGDVQLDGSTSLLTPDNSSAEIRVTGQHVQVHSVLDALNSTHFSSVNLTKLEIYRTLYSSNYTTVQISFTNSALKLEGKVVLNHHSNHTVFEFWVHAQRISSVWMFTIGISLDQYQSFPVSRLVPCLKPMDSWQWSAGVSLVLTSYSHFVSLPTSPLPVYLDRGITLVAILSASMQSNLPNIEELHNLAKSNEILLTGHLNLDDMTMSFFAGVGSDLVKLPHVDIMSLGMQYEIDKQHLTSRSGVSCIAAIHFSNRTQDIVPIRGAVFVDVQMSAAIRAQLLQDWVTPLGTPGLVIHQGFLNLEFNMETMIPRAIQFDGGFHVGSSAAGQLTLSMRDGFSAYRGELQRINLKSLVEHMLGDDPLSQFLALATDISFGYFLVSQNNGWKTVELSPNDMVEPNSTGNVPAFQLSHRKDQKFVIPPGFHLELDRFNLWNVFRGSVEYEIDIKHVLIMIELEPVIVLKDLLEIRGNSLNESASAMVKLGRETDFLQMRVVGQIVVLGIRLKSETTIEDFNWYINVNGTLLSDLFAVDMQLESMDMNETSKLPQDFKVQVGMNEKLTDYINANIATLLQNMHKELKTYNAHEGWREKIGDFFAGILDTGLDLIGKLLKTSSKDILHVYSMDLEAQLSKFGKADFGTLHLRVRFAGKDQDVTIGADTIHDVEALGQKVVATVLNVFHLFQQIAHDFGDKVSTFIKNTVGKGVDWVKRKMIGLSQSKNKVTTAKRWNRRKTRRMIRWKKAKLRSAKNGIRKIGRRRRLRGTNNRNRSRNNKRVVQIRKPNFNKRQKRYFW